MYWSFLGRSGMTEGGKLHLGNCVRWKTNSFFYFKHNTYSVIVLPCELVPFSPLQTIHQCLWILSMVTSFPNKRIRICHLPSENVPHLWPANRPFLYPFQSCPFFVSFSVLSLFWGVARKTVGSIQNTRAIRNDIETKMFLALFTESQNGRGWKGPLWVI